MKNHKKFLCIALLIIKLLPSPSLTNACDPSYGCSVIDMPSNKLEESYLLHSESITQKHYLELGYYCSPENPINFKNIDSVALITSHGQVFRTHKWCMGERLPFAVYRENKMGRLTLKEDLFPIHIAVSHITARQPLHIAKDAIYNNLRNTHITDLKTWGEPCVFSIDKEDIFSPMDDQMRHRLIIICEAPASPKTTLYLE